MTERFRELGYEQAVEQERLTDHPPPEPAPKDGVKPRYPRAATLVGDGTVAKAPVKKPEKGKPLTAKQKLAGSFFHEGGDDKPTTVFGRKYTHVAARSSTPARKTASSSMSAPPRADAATAAKPAKRST
jgi:hypothetical protein